MLNSQAYPIGRSLTLARGWFPGTYSYCLYQVRFVTIDGDDGGGGNSNGDSDDDGDNSDGDYFLKGKTYMKKQQFNHNKLDLYPIL